MKQHRKHKLSKNVINFFQTNKSKVNKVNVTKFRKLFEKLIKAITT